MKGSLIDALDGHILLADGAIGTELQRRGLEPGACAESWNTGRPDQVQAVHRDYVEAGARLLTTNSFRGTRYALAGFGLAEQTVELNRRAAELAKAAAGDRAWILGSIGPFGGFLMPMGETSVDQLYSWFLEQVSALLEGGADGIVVETMAAREEVETAIRAARAAGAAVVAAAMTFEKGREGHRTMMGVTAGDAARVMAGAGADIVGTNCGTGLIIRDYAHIVTQFREAVSAPILVRPNAGAPQLAGDRVYYTQSPEAMASEISALVSAGARIIGGCCGTTPEHIRAFARELGK
ncbi:MAG: homocysteine S-methyltransferase family protein [Acidobacteria bacterium]|nr:homocysteine S-methyltransferase family protein [Acidobacteriota bacterium]